MRCTSCGHDNELGARFCSDCGQTTAAAQGGADEVPETTCMNCGRRTYALPYFSRGWNIAKAVVLVVPFNVIGPVLFFLLRKDRAICAACRRLLPGETRTPLLMAFSHEPIAPPLALLGPVSHDETSRELVPATRALVWRSRASRAQAYVSGLVSTVFLGIGASQLPAGIEEAAPLGIVAAFFAGVAGFAARSSARLQARAVAIEGKERTLRLLDLARQHEGRLTVPLVAAELRLDMQESERALDAMVDGRYVDLQIGEEGQVSYLFRGLT